jgi:HlyD family secretion protein
MFGFLRRPWFWILIVIVGAAVGGVMFMGAQQKAAKARATAAARNAPPSPYAAIANGKADVEGGIVQIAARAPGVIRSVYVQEGDRVAAGQILARQEDDQQRLQVQRAGAEVRQAAAAIQATNVQIRTAQREYDRLQKLVATNFVAGQKLDQARDAIAAAQATLAAQQAAVATAQARLREAQYNLELTVIRAPMSGRIVRRYANPGAGASTLNVSNMFDLEPDAPRIVRAEIVEAAIPIVSVGQEVEISPEADPSKVYVGRVLRRAALFGARKLQSDDPSERTDERVVEVVVTADGAPLLIGQRVLVKFMKPGQHAGAAHPGVPVVTPPGVNGSPTRE